MDVLQLTPELEKQIAQAGLALRRSGSHPQPEDPPLYMKIHLHENPDITFGLHRHPMAPEPCGPGFGMSAPRSDPYGNAFGPITSLRITWRFSGWR